MKRSRRRPRAVLFDLDGVLIDSYEVWFHLLNQAARELGYPTIAHELYHECWGQSTSADRDRFFPRHSLNEVEDFYRKHYFEHIDLLRVPEEVPSVFDRLRALRIRTSVVTNTQTSLATLLVQRTGGRPDAIVGGGDAPFGKPAPDLLLVACERLEVGPESAWMVGDSVYDREAARAAGTFFVGVGIDGGVRVGGLEEVVALASADDGEG
jgi:AHBA synthesis associated protein